MLTEVHVASLESWLRIDFKDKGSNPLTVGRESKLFINDELVEDLSIPEGVKKINNWAFSEYSSIRSVFYTGRCSRAGQSCIQFMR